MDYFDFLRHIRVVSRFFIEFSRFFPAIIISLILINCSHIGHRANVKKGVNLSLMVAPSRETYKPPQTAWYQSRYGGKEITEKGRTDLQMSWGYAWQFRSSRKLMLQANFAIAVDEGYYIPSTGLYYQVTRDDSPAAVGFGTIIGLDPMLYFLWGRDFLDCANCKAKSGMDIGFGFGTGPSYLIDARYFRKFTSAQLGFFIEYRRFPNILDLGFENRDYDSYLKSRWSFGVIFIP